MGTGCLFQFTYCDSRRPIIAKRSSSARKVWYAKGVAKKVPMENGTKQHRKALQRQGTGETEKHYQK